MKLLFSILLFIFCFYSLSVATLTSEEIQVIELKEKLSECYDDMQKIEILDTLSKLVAINNNNEALNYLNQELILAENNNLFKNILSISYEIASNYYNSQNYNEAIIYLLKLIDVKTKLNNTDGFVNIYELLAYSYLSIGMFDEALITYYKLINIHTNQNNIHEIIDIHLKIGNLYLYSNNKLKSIEAYLQALKYSDILNDPKSTINCCINIAIIYTNLLQYAAAMDYYKRALDISVSINDHYNMSNIYHNISGLYLEQKVYDTALYYINEAVYYAEVSHNYTISAASYASKALLAFNDKKYSECLSDLYLSNSYYKLSDYNYGIHYNNNEIAKLLIIINSNIHIADSLLKDTYEYANKIHDNKLLSLVNKTYSMYYKINKNFKYSYNYLKIYDNLNDSINNADNNRKIADYELVYKNNVKNKELQIENIKYNSEVFQKIGAFTIFIILFILSLIIFVLYKNKKKKNIQILKNNLQIELNNADLKVLNTEILRVNKNIELKKEELEHANNIIQNDIARASRYAISLLPEKINQKIIKTDWIYVPSNQLAGDAFNHHWIDSDNFAFYLIDASGNGIGSTLHAISVQNVLKSKLLVNVDQTSPQLVLFSLNNIFQMSNHNGMYFTIWYGVLNIKTGILNYSSAGYPAPMMINSEKQKIILHSDNEPIGNKPKQKYSQESIYLDGINKIILFSESICKARYKDNININIDNIYNDIYTIYMKIDNYENNTIQLNDKLKLFYNNYRNKTINNTFEDDYLMLSIEIDLTNTLVKTPERKVV